MKKSLFFLATAALVLASCQNDVKLAENTTLVTSNQPKEIAFAPLSSTPKRAIKRAAADTYQYAIDGTEFPTDLNMYVAAYQVEPTPAANYFAGTQYIYNDATGKWGGATKRYWPLSDCYINFLAYANVTGTAAFNATNYASEAVINQTDNSAAQTDLMYAIGNGQVTKAGNALTFENGGVVNMAFKHAQAWMDFYVKANSTEETAITINSITLKGGKYAGKYTITHTNYNAKTAQSVAGDWSELAAAKDAVVPGWSATALTTGFAHVGKGLLVIPDADAATNDWTSFVINYTLNEKTYDYEYTAPTAPGATLEQAKHYVFNITFKLHEILVDATITDWTDVNNYITIISDASFDKDAATKEVNLSNAAGKYLIEVTGLTAGQDVSVTVTSDDDDIISAVALQGDKVGANGNVVIEVTKVASSNDQTAEITLTVNATDYVITLKTPVTPEP